MENKCIIFSENETKDTTTIQWEKNNILPFRYSSIFNSNKEKYINSTWLNLPVYKSKYIIKGLVDSGGSKNNDTINYANESRKIVESCRFILIKMGIIPRIEKRKIKLKAYFHLIFLQNLILSNKQYEDNITLYKLIIPKTSDICHMFKIDVKKYVHFFRFKNLLFTKIISIENKDYNGTLYDLQLKKTHDYMIHNGIVHNGGGKRNGSFAIYLEPWHGDIFEFLDLKKNHGDEDMRAGDLFYALWIPDLFMDKGSE